MLIKCDYCGNIISLTDKTCPQCGSDVTGAIRRAKEEEKRKNKARQDRLFSGFRDVNKRTVKVLIAAAAVLVVGFIIYAIQPLLSQALLFRGIMSSTYGETKTEKAVSVGFNEWAEQSNKKVIVDKYTSYQYQYSSGKLEVDEGFVRVAFHLTVMNTSTKDYYESQDIKCTIDGNEAEKAKGSYRCAITDPSVDTLNDFRCGYLYVNTGREGWVSYNVPLDAKKITFQYGDNITINMDNPYYGQ